MPGDALSNVLQLRRKVVGDDRDCRAGNDIRAARPTGRTFAPRYAIELTPGGAQTIPPTTTRPAPMSGGRFGRGLGSSNRSSGSAFEGYARTSTPSFGPTYIYQYPYCSKQFQRKKQDSTLRAHKAPNGWDCSGRTGYLVEIR